MAATLVLSIPAPLSSSCAARRATRGAEHLHASLLPTPRARRRARNVLPAPALPATTATASPPSVSRRTIARCSGERYGLAPQRALDLALRDTSRPLPLALEHGAR